MAPWSSPIPAPKFSLQMHYTTFIGSAVTIGVDLAGLLGGRMASAEGGSVSSGMAYGEGCLLSSRLRGLGERRELPQRILAYSEGHRTLIFVPIWQNLGGGGQFVLGPPPLQILGGDLPPPCPPVIYAHGRH